MRANDTISHPYPGCNVSELTNRLRSTIDPVGQIILLDELCFLLCSSDKKLRWEYAKRHYNIAKSLENPYWLARSHMRFSDCFCSESQHEESEKHLREALEHSNRMSKPYAVQSMVYSRLGRTLYYQKRVDEAFQAIKNSLNLSKYVQSKREVGAIYGMAGALYRRQGLLETSLGFLISACNLFKEINHSAGNARLLRDIGMIYTSLKNHDSALTYFNESLAQAHKTVNRYLEGEIYIDIARIIPNHGKNCQAIELLHRAKDIFYELDCMPDYGRCLRNLGDVYRVMKNVSKMDYYYQEAMKVYKDIGSDEGLVDINGCMGCGALICGEWDRAISLLKSSLDFRLRTNEKPLQSYLYYYLAQAYEGGGYIYESLKCYKEHVKLERVMCSGEIQQKISTFRLYYYSDDDPIEGEGKSNEVDSSQFCSLPGKETALLTLQIAQNENLLNNLRERLLSLKENESFNIYPINELIAEINNNQKLNHAWDVFKSRLDSFDPGAQTALSVAYPSLTPAELRICSLLKMNMSNKDISVLLNISDRTVDTHRTKIRKKLGLKRGENLVVILSGINREE